MFDLDAYERISRGEEVNNTSPSGYLNKVSIDRFIVGDRTRVSGGFYYLTLKNRTEKFEKVRVQLSENIEVGEVVDCLGYRINLGKDKGIIYVACLGCRKSPDQNDTLLKDPEFNKVKGQTIVNELLDLIQNESIKSELKVYFENHPEFFLHKGARGMHHAYVGGLVEHSVNVARTAINIAKNYSGLNLDVIIAGALLHDIGKQYELSDTGYTISGNLLGHISLGMLEFQKCMGNIPYKAELLHIIVSHHGQLEWGSPVKPNTREAYIVHIADLLDSRMAMMFADELNLKQYDTTWSKGADGYIMRTQENLPNVYTTE